MKTVVYRTARGAIIQQVAAFEKTSSHYHMKVNRKQTIQAGLFVKKFSFNFLVSDWLPYGIAYSGWNYHWKRFSEGSQDCTNVQRCMYRVPSWLCSWWQRDKNIPLFTVSSTIRKSSRYKNLKLDFLRNISLNVLLWIDFHMVKLTVVHDIIYGCCADTAVMVMVVNRGRTDWNDRYTVERK